MHLLYVYVFFTNIKISVSSWTSGRGVQLWTGQVQWTPQDLRYLPLQQFCVLLSSPLCPVFIIVMSSSYVAPPPGTQRECPVNPAPQNYHHLESNRALLRPPSGPTQSENMVWCYLQCTCVPWLMCVLYRPNDTLYLHIHVLHVHIYRYTCTCTYIYDIYIYVRYYVSRIIYL